MNTLFKPEENLMKQLSLLTKENAKTWWKEYLKYHKGVDQGVAYLIGYFPEVHRNFLKREFDI